MTIKNSSSFRLKKKVMHSTQQFLKNQTTRIRLRWSPITHDYSKLKKWISWYWTRCSTKDRLPSFCFNHFCFFSEITSCTPICSTSFFTRFSCRLLAQFEGLHLAFLPFPFNLQSDAFLHSSGVFSEHWSPDAAGSAGAAVVVSGAVQTLSSSVAFVLQIWPSSHSCVNVSFVGVQRHALLAGSLSAHTSMQT